MTLEQRLQDALHINAPGTRTCAGRIGTFRAASRRDNVTRQIVCIGVANRSVHRGRLSFVEDENGRQLRRPPLLAHPLCLYFQEPWQVNRFARSDLHLPTLQLLFDFAQ